MRNIYLILNIILILSSMVCKAAEGPTLEVPILKVQKFGPFGEWQKTCIFFESNEEKIIVTKNIQFAGKPSVDEGDYAKTNNVIRLASDLSSLVLEASKCSIDSIKGSTADGTVHLIEGIITHTPMSPIQNYVKLSLDYGSMKFINSYKKTADLTSFANLNCPDEISFQ